MGCWVWRGESAGATRPGRWCPGNQAVPRSAGRARGHWLGGASGRAESAGRSGVVVGLMGSAKGRSARAGGPGRGTSAGLGDVGWAGGGRPQGVGSRGQAVLSWRGGRWRGPAELSGGGSAGATGPGASVPGTSGCAELVGRGAVVVGLFGSAGAALQRPKCRLGRGRLSPGRWALGGVRLSSWRGGAVRCHGPVEVGGAALLVAGGPGSGASAGPGRGAPEGVRLCRVGRAGWGAVEVGGAALQGPAPAQASDGPGCPRPRALGSSAGSGHAGLAWRSLSWTCWVQRGRSAGAGGRARGVGPGRVGDGWALAWA
jgi:hypothetical protein